MLFHVTDAQVKSTKPNLHPPTTCKLLSLLSKHQWHQFSFSNRFLLYAEAKCRGTDTWELQFFPSFSVTSRGRGSALLQWIGPLRKMINYQMLQRIHRIYRSQSLRVSENLGMLYGNLWNLAVNVVHSTSASETSWYLMAKRRRWHRCWWPFQPCQDPATQWPGETGGRTAVNLAMRCVCWM